MGISPLPANLVELGVFEIKLVERYIEQLRRHVVSIEDLRTVIDNTIFDIEPLTKSDGKRLNPKEKELSAIGEGWKSVRHSYSLQQLHSNLFLRINRCLFGFRIEGLRYRY